MVICATQNEGQFCPISKGKCPGICVFAEIFENINIGIIVLNVGSKDVLFQNECALSLFRSAENSGSYDYLRSLLFSNISDEELKEKKFSPFTLNLLGIIYGYTVYYIGSGFLWIFINDITDKKRLESIAEAVEIMDNVGYIFSGIRHEIGNPINSIKMTLSVLKNNLDTFSKEAMTQYVERSLAEITRVEYLLKSLRSFSLFERAEIKEMDVSVFLDKLLSLVGEDFSKKGVHVSSKVQEGAKRVLADPRLLQQVMLNILVNAVDAVEGRKDPEIAINVTRFSGLVWVRVIDNGCGIKPEQMKEIFKPFYTSKPHGTGLGMAITRKMLASMKCTIEVESTVDIGTAIIISIPEGNN